MNGMPAAGMAAGSLQRTHKALYTTRQPEAQEEEQDGGSSSDIELLFEGVKEALELDHRHVGNCVEDFILRHVVLSFSSNVIKWGPYGAPGVRDVQAVSSCF